MWTSVSLWVEAAAAAAGQKVSVRRHAGFDHSYFFISSFMEDHVKFHAKVGRCRLTG
jgi:S-formylglutathione hydrolase FrmB